MKLALFATRKMPRDAPEEHAHMADSEGRYIVSTSGHNLREVVYGDLPDGMDPAKKEAEFMLKHLQVRDMDLGDGDLFEDHQTEPLAAIMYAVGMTCIETPKEAYEFCARMEHWSRIPDERKLYEMFGSGAAFRLCQCLTKLMDKSWTFKVQDLDANDPSSLVYLYIPNLTEAEFHGLLK